MQGSMSRPFGRDASPWRWDSGLPAQVANVRLPRNTETADRVDDMAQPARGFVMLGKRVQFDDETWNALDLLARDRMQDFQELADEAFSDLLRKHGRPTDLKAALRQSIEDAKNNIESSLPDFVKRTVLPSVRRGPKYSVPRRTKIAGDRDD
jgi:hypothetical protein